VDWRDLEMRNVELAPNEELYMDGTIAKEIEHLLVMRLHHLNTILEIELLKQKIHQMMMDNYNYGKARNE